MEDEGVPTALASSLEDDDIFLGLQPVSNMSVS